MGTTPETHSEARRMCETLFYSVRKTARILGITPGDASELCNIGVLESTYSGARRLVVPASVTAYAASLLDQS